MKKVTQWRIIIVSLIVIAGLVYFISTKTKYRLNDSNPDVKIDASIAVLPFESLSNNPEQGYFSDGLTEGILNSLAHLKGLKVSAYTSSFKFRGNHTNIKEIGKELAVHSILRGTVQRQGDHIRITAQLLNADDSVQFWSAQYDENADDIFSIQNKITSAIAEKLKIILVGEDQQLIAKKPTTSVEAFDLCLKGRVSWNKRSASELRKGIDFFRQAIAIDTSYAAAYSGIADCYNALGYGSFVKPGDAFPKAIQAATKAVQLDSTLAEPHASLGFYEFYYNWDWAAAEQEFRTAIALNPNYSLAYEWYGYYLTAMQRYNEAEIVLKKAAEVDPLSAPVLNDMGFSLYYSGNYDQSIKKLEASLQLNPNYALAHIWLGRCYQAKKMYPQAIAEFKTTMAISPGWPVGLAQIGNAYGVSGDKTDGQKTLDTLLSLSEKQYVSAYGIALIYAGLNEKENVFIWLNRAYEERSNWMVWLKNDPRWIPFHSDKRYAELINKVQLPQ
jgi:TolB-like protein/Tfp pilus assembly protein PilF